MALDIFWTAEAEMQLDEVTQFLESNWTDKEITSFFKRLEKSLSAIALNPTTYKLSHRKEGVREFLITKHTTIFYTFDNNYVYIISIWSNKQQN